MTAPRQSARRAGGARRRAKEGGEGAPPRTRAVAAVVAVAAEAAVAQGETAAVGAAKAVVAEAEAEAEAGGGGGGERATNRQGSASCGAPRRGSAVCLSVCTHSSVHERDHGAWNCFRRLLAVVLSGGLAKVRRRTTGSVVVLDMQWYLARYQKWYTVPATSNSYAVVLPYSILHAILEYRNFT
jgi:hypothetical protein